MKLIEFRVIVRMPEDHAAARSTSALLTTMSRILQKQLGDKVDVRLEVNTPHETH